MKYAIIFAATAAAQNAYGGYNAQAQSSAPVKPSTTSKPAAYTTVCPGYGKEDVTVTQQNQAYPTCVAAAYGGKSCDKWNEDMYVSTVIKDYDNNYATVTKTDQNVVVYHTKTTITHSATPTAGYAAPTGISAKNGTENCWYELYEKIEEVPYKELGPNALPGYSGSGLYPQGSKEQPVHVKEFKGGKWSEYEHAYSYGAPKPEVKVYEKPGVYVVPSKDVVVQHPVDQPAEATTTAKAGETCTYGGQYVHATTTGYITAPYAAYKTKAEGGKTVTETVISYTTVYASTTGSYEVAKPTTTVYDHDVEVTYPTAKHYDAGVYHQPAQTVTITSAGQSYTCEFEKHAATPVASMGYGYTKPSTSPMSPHGGNKYPSQPAKSSPGSGYAAYPVSSSPAAASSKSAYAGGNGGGYGYGYVASTMVTVPSKEYATSSVPAYGASSSSTSCESSSATSATSSPAAYKSYPAVSSPAAYPVISTPAAYPVVSTPAAYEQSSSSSTSCESESESATPVAYQPASSSPAAYQPAPAVSSPAAYPVVSTPAAYPVVSTPAAYPVVSTPAAYPVVSTPAAYQPAPAASSPAAGNSYGDNADNSYGAQDNSYGSYASY